MCLELFLRLICFQIHETVKAIAVVSPLKVSRYLTG